MRVEEVEEVEVTVERKPKNTNKKKGKVGRPKKEEKKRQIPGGFTEAEIARMEDIISSSEDITSMAHFMRKAGLKLLEELETK